MEDNGGANDQLMSRDLIDVSSVSKSMTSNKLPSEIRGVLLKTETKTKTTTTTTKRSQVGEQESTHLHEPLIAGLPALDLPYINMSHSKLLMCFTSALLLWLLLALSLAVHGTHSAGSVTRPGHQEDQVKSQQRASDHLKSSWPTNRKNEPGQVWDITNETLVISVAEHEPAWGLIQAKIDTDQNQAHNFTVFVMSNNPNHIAVVLELEQIDMEIRNNCEFQKLSIALADLSEPLSSLNASNTNNNTTSNTTTGSGPNSTDGSDPEVCESAMSPMISFPMFMHDLWLIYNMPLNRTLLQPGQDNDFRLVNSLADWVHELTCSELHSPANKTSGSVASDSNNGKAMSIGTLPVAGGSERNEPEDSVQGSTSQQMTTAQIRLAKPTRLRKPVRRRNERYQQRANTTSGRSHGGNQARLLQCDTRSPKYRELANKHLLEEIGWTNLLDVCGPISKLVVPLRYFRLRVRSDEFAKSASFRLRFRFIEDPAELDYAGRGQFLCKNRKIIPLESRCDGHDDCGDASDDHSGICHWPDSERESAIEAANGKSDTTDSGSEKELPIAVKKRRSTGSQKPTSQEKPSDRKLRYFDKSLLHCCDSHNAWRNVFHDLKISDSFGSRRRKRGYNENQDEHSKQPAGKIRRKRIVNGEPVLQGQWPAQVSLQSDHIEPFSHWCGGVLVHPEYVLTAAHCITDDYTPYHIKVVVGETDMMEIRSNSSQIRYAVDLLVYPGMGWRRLREMSDWKHDEKNDFAILKLHAPVILSDNVMPACLPPVNVPPIVGSQCEILGWGRTHGSGNQSQLKRIKQNLVEPAECIENLGDIHRFDNDTMLCIKNPPNKNEGICEGDSGGPLYCERQLPSGGKCKELAGIVSSSIELEALASMCGVHGPLNMYADVARKSSWISSSIDMFEALFAKGQRV